MPVISDERRAERRAQILNAAWTCFHREGLHLTTMDHIIKASGLSAGAVYGYFKSKDELILAALTTSLSGVRDILEPIFRAEPFPPPDQLAREIAAAITGFTARDGFDLKRVALLGWSEAQRNAPLRATMRGFYVVFRDQLRAAAERWRSAGVIDAQSGPEDVAKTLLALVLGFVVEAAIMGDVEPAEIGAGLRGLAAPARAPASQARRGGRKA